MKRLGFGIMGCGNASKVHAEGIKSIENAGLVAASRTENSARKLAKGCNCDYYTDLDASPKREDTDIDAVVILTLNGLHSDIGIKAAKCGKYMWLKNL